MESVFYLGACTSKGFVSHYDSLLEEVRNLNIIKGGSGCGKSTFMRAIGQAARERGLDVSYILCSSDPDSLDAVLIPELSVGFVDGTAPHVLEPKLCGGSVNYLNFGEFYDRAAMQPNEAEILEIQTKNRAQYPLVTACLHAADALFDCVRYSTENTSYHEEMQAISECLCLSALRPRGQKGKTVRRFLTAITPKGMKYCSQSPSALCSRVYVLRDNYSLAPRLLETVHKRATELGHDCIACFSPLLPEGKPTHLLIPSADTAFVCESRDFPYDGPCFCRIDLDATLSQSLRKELEFCCQTTSNLLYQATAHLREAKLWHDRIEQLCKPFVDFKAVDALTRETIKALF